MVTCLNLCVPCTIEFQSRRSLQTLLLRISLSRLGGKHRQLARRVEDSASSPANSMVGSSDANNVPDGITIVFGSWACTADGSGGFSSHLVTPNSPEPKTISQLTDIRESADLDKQRVLPELDSDNPENMSTPTRTPGSVEFDTNSDSEKPHFSETFGKILDSSQNDQTPQDQKLRTTQRSKSSFTINRGLHQTCRNYSWLIYITAEPRSMEPTTEKVRRYSLRDRSSKLQARRLLYQDS